jgi:hypothetical protein
MHMLDHAEQEQEPSAEQAPVEDVTNIFPEQGKPWCIPPLFLDFAFNHYLMLSMIVY